MGASPSRPSEAQQEELRQSFDERCANAAKFIAGADILLLCTGAGFSADSGLAIYADVAKVPAYARLNLTYQELCQPHWLQRDPALFWGFWGQCFNDYRETPPHEGYEIISRWADQRFRNSTAAQSIRQRLTAAAEFQEEPASILDEPYRVTDYPGAFYVFTSNVDAHHYDWFKASEIRECHGNTEVYQCGADESRAGHPKSGCERVWRAPLDCRFDVHKATMTAPGPPGERAAASEGVEAVEEPAVAEEPASTEAGTADAPPRIGHVRGGGRDNMLRYMGAASESRDGDLSFTGEHANRPRCIQCGGPARPAILMFSDYGFLDMGSQHRRWTKWLKAAHEYIKEQSQPDEVKVAILEIGAGDNVTTVRATSEEHLEDFQDDGADVKLFRVNPVLPYGDRDKFAPDGQFSSNVVPIYGKGLESLRRIDHAMQVAAIVARDQQGALG